MLRARSACVHVPGLCALRSAWGPARFPDPVLSGFTRPSVRTPVRRGVARVGVLPPVVSAQQGARVVPRLQREPAVPLEVPQHAQNQGVQGAHVQVRTYLG